MQIKVGRHEGEENEYVANKENEIKCNTLQ